MVDYVETFNKVDGLGLGPDQPWVDAVAGMRTVTQRATLTTASVDALSYMDVDLGSPNHSADAVLSGFGNANYFDLKVILRWNDINNYYAAMRGFRTANGFFVNFRRVIGGVTTELYETGPTPADGDTFTAEVEDDVANIYINDVLFNTYEAGGLLTGNRVGLGAFRSVTTATRNMFVDTLTAHGPDAPPIPANVSAVGSSGLVAVTWDPSAGATSYDIQREQWFGEEEPV